MNRLSEEQIEIYLRQVPGWKFENNALVKLFKREHFNEGMRFANGIALLADKANHHPDLQIQYSRVIVRLTTHDEGGVTGKDFSLAQQIEALVETERS
ncbi:4a-hydroxytetrahydrobiopterin dehydratase [Paenibacillus sp. J2TS4]|uniref:4a-hydroxytetrahydrobiopterin dehydratase n=1 Tax=Paenibacillus sp. J2TS4 TaxID=2807194 RepID=UPI001B27C5E3|nr:4a-hydroxytetrahydrobiopterin dehydratase [Paenibacillus sp. J2TS4]GIP35808.1 putative pterin-4-alpha-carbinolamine dehydratase [Paenibacillus sp. J2TS4]